VIAEGVIGIMRSGKRLGEDATTLAAVLCFIAPAFCSAQIPDRFGFSPPGSTQADRLAGEIAPEERLPGVPPGVDPLHAASQETVLSGSPPREQSTGNAAAPCLQPSSLFRWQEYRGPYQKAVGIFVGKLELKSAHPPHYKSGTVLCSLGVKDKFILFVRDTFEPVSFLAAAFDAGLDQASDRDPTFGQGAEGYGKRFGADFAGQTTWRFFTDFAYPTIFAEDPRYYRLIQGSGKRRFFHAVGHTFVAHRDSGKHMFNCSVWLGTATAIALSDVYHPGNERGLSPAMRAGGFALATGMGFDVLREFWPDIAHKLHLPFRDTREESATASSRSPQP
jgi:hypothetical protein